MGKAFFNGWALWEKMTFVLAAGIVGIVLAALTRVAWSFWQLREYKAVAVARREHLRKVRQSREVIQLRCEDVPFGRRAVESGIEIDGVWISRPNTPEPSIHSVTPATPPAGPSSSSPISSPSQRRASSISDTSRLSVPGQTRTRLSDGLTASNRLSADQGASHSRHRSPDSRINRSGSPGPSRAYEQQPFKDDSLTHGVHQPIPGQAARSISEGHLYAHGALANNNSSPSHSASSHEWNSQKPESASSSHSSKSSGYQSSHNDPFSDVQRSPQPDIEPDSTDYQRLATSEPIDRPEMDPSRLYPQRLAKVRYSSTSGSSLDGLQDGYANHDLDAENRTLHLESLAHHRLSHVAEVGQLLPRPHRSAQSGEWSKTTDSARNSQHLTRSNHARSRTSSQYIEDVRDPFLTPPGSGSPEMAANAGHLGPDPLTHAKSPQLEADCEPQATKIMYGLEDDQIGPLRPSDVNQKPHLNQTIRKVNSGFEVLPAGYLTDNSGKGKKIQGSEEWNIDLEQGRDLQLDRPPRRRPGSKGKVSSFTESF